MYNILISNNEFRCHNYGVIKKIMNSFLLIMIREYRTRLFAGTEKSKITLDL